MKFAICNEMFQGWILEDVFRLAAEIGYDGVEIAPFTLADTVTEIDPRRRSEIRKLAASCGLDITGIHWLYFF